MGSIVLHVPWVLPTDPLWSLGLIGIGIAGFIGQVKSICSLDNPLGNMILIDWLPYLKVLLTKGLQTETASRGSIGLYVQVRGSH